MSKLKQLTLNDICYNFKEEFDVNLTLSYENENWSEWHILREFISNALDSVNGDMSKISIAMNHESVMINDNGDGYPLVYAKRIGATNKKDNSDLIGNFGEGIKISLVTCIRANVHVLLASRNWLISPKVVSVENQDVLFYDIYESEQELEGTTVVLDATENILEIISNISDYFLQFHNKNDCLFDSSNGCIYPLLNDKARLYNKGVYVKDIIALYSYGINLEGLNRDRDFISNYDIAYAVRKVLERLDNQDIIKSIIKASSLPRQERNNMIEFYSEIYAANAEIWKQSFEALYGIKALLYTDDFAEREAIALGYQVVKCDYNIENILIKAGVKKDTETLTEDWEFELSDELEPMESYTLDKIFAVASLLETDIPKDVKVFDEYANHENILGLFNKNNNHIYMRKNVLNASFETALGTFLHEANHHLSGADDVSREFADNLSSMLAKLLLKYAENIGLESEIKIVDNGITLPSIFPVTASSTVANIIALGNRLIVYTGSCTVETNLPVACAEAVVTSRKIRLNKNALFLKLPLKILSGISGYDSLKCKILLERGVVNEYGY